AAKPDSTASHVGVRELAPAFLRRGLPRRLSELRPNGTAANRSSLPCAQTAKQASPKKSGGEPPHSKRGSQRRVVNLRLPRAAFLPPLRPGGLPAARGRARALPPGQELQFAAQRFDSHAQLRERIAHAFSLAAFSQILEPCRRLARGLRAEVSH